MRNLLDLAVASWMLAWTTVALRVVPPARLIARPSGRPGRTRAVRHDSAELARLLRIADLAARFVVPVSCLPKSLALARFLERRGIAATVRIGVRTAAGRLEAHAWVVVDGRVVNDDAAGVARYQVLRESSLEAAGATVPVTSQAVVDALDRHGVAPLVADRIRKLLPSARPAWADGVMDIARANAAADLIREKELRAAIAALDAAGVQPIIFKGAHLAHRDYARPDLRPRVDSDILIRDGEPARKAAHDTLVALGYETRAQVGGTWLMTQRLYVKRDRGHARHAVDLHWRVANPQAFASSLTHAEIWREAEPVPALGLAARGPAGPHALLIACMHRVAHHANDQCVIWLKDIDLIARRLSATEWAQFASLAWERRVRAVCLESLMRAAETFDTPRPQDIVGNASHRAGHEPSAGYLNPPRSRVGAVWTDIRALPSWSARLALLREYVLPPAKYMREIYAPGSASPIVWLYAKRAVTAVFRSSPDPAGSTASGSG